MDTVVPREQLQKVLDQSTRLVMKEAAGILLNHEEVSLGREIYTVYTHFSRGFRSCLAFYADTSLFKRLTCHMMQTEQVDAADIRDFTTEYFNVLCGHIVSALFLNTRIAARFDIPSFCEGVYQPEGQLKHIVLGYASDLHENARLVCYATPALFT